MYCSPFPFQDNWHCDQYRWVNQGVTKLPRKCPKLKKLYFDADTPGGVSKDFQRQAYQLLENNSLTLIHYKGDEKVFRDFPHRSSRKSHLSAHVHLLSENLNSVAVPTCLTLSIKSMLQA